MQKDRTNLKIIVAVIVSVIISSSITALAAIKISATEIGYNNTTVADQLDSIYQTMFSNNYSAEEKQIGKWIDGKPLYQKTFISDSPTTGNTNLIIGTIENMDTSFIVDGFYINQSNDFGYAGSSYMLTNTGRNTDKTTYTAYFFVRPDGNIMGLFGETTASSKIVVTVRYTKTTDEPITNE